KRFLGALGHEEKEFAEGGGGGVFIGGQDGAEAEAFERKDDGSFLGVDKRTEYDAVPEIVIVDACAIRDAELLAVHIEFVAIDDGPECALGKRKFAGEDAGLKRGSMRLPAGADEILGEGALDAGDAEDG